MSRIFEVPTKPWDDYKLYNRKTIAINPGVTVLTGCNGTGKSTLMRLMKEQLERKKYQCIYMIIFMMVVDILCKCS